MVTAVRHRGPSSRFLSSLPQIFKPPALKTAICKLQWTFYEVRLYFFKRIYSFEVDSVVDVETSEKTDFNKIQVILRI